MKPFDPLADLNAAEDRFVQDHRQLMSPTFWPAKKLEQLVRLAFSAGAAFGSGRARRMMASDANWIGWAAFAGMLLGGLLVFFVEYRS